jgi:hypothetical protein
MNILHVIRAFHGSIYSAGRLSGFPYRALCRHVGARAISLAYKIRNDPAALALLDPVDFEANELGAAQPAGDQKRQDGAVALAFKHAGVGRNSKDPSVFKIST